MKEVRVGGGATSSKAEQNAGHASPGKSTLASTPTSDAGGAPASSHWPDTGHANPMWETIPPGDPDGGVTHETEWEAGDGSGRSRDQVGVGERVGFAAGGNGTWSATAGTRTGTGSRFAWAAPEAAGAATITFQPSGGGAPIAKTLGVHAPARVVLTKIADETMDPGAMGAGFQASVALHPLNVSFAATEWKEDTGQTGEAAQGYFSGKALPTHVANPRWLGIGAGNSGPTDRVAFGGFPSPWSAGNFQWSIAQRWKLRSGTAANLIETLAQTCVVEGKPHAGRTTVTKAGASATRSPTGEETAAHDATGYGIGDSRPAKAPESWEVVNKHDVKFLSAVADRVKANDIPQPHGRLTWTGKDDARQAIGARIYEYVRAVDKEVLKRLMLLCPTTDLYALVDDARRGPDGTRTDVAVIRVAAAFDEPLRQAILRMGMRTVVQIDKHNGIKPRADDVVASSPLDGIIVEVMLQAGRTVWSPRKAGAANDTGNQSFKDGVRSGRFEKVAYTWMGGRDKNLWNWIHVTEPKHVTAEDVAQFDLLANGQPNPHSEEAYRIAANPPYFGIPAETAQLVPDARRHAPDDVLVKLDTADPGPRIAGGGALAKSVASDDAALASAPKPSKSDLSITRAIDRTRSQLAYMQGALAPWKSAAPLKGATDFVARRASEAISDPKGVARYATAMTAQERILNAASSEVGEILGDLEKNQVTPDMAKAIAPVVDVLLAYATAAGTSHLADAGEAALAEARRQRKLLPLALAESKIKSAREQLVAQSKAEEGSTKLEEHSADNIAALPSLTRRAADLRLAAAQGKDLDPDDVERLTLDASVVELRARLVTMGTQTRTLRGRGSEVGLAKGTHPGGFWSVDMVCNLILEKIREYQGRLDNAHVWTGPGYDKKLRKLNTKQTENQKLREEIKLTESLFADFAKTNGLYKVKGDPAEDFFAWAYAQVADKQLANLIASIAIQVGVAVITGQVVGAVGATIRGLTAAAEIGATLREASLLYRGASILVQAGVQTGTQAALGQDVSTATFAENALGLVLTSAAMKPFQALLDDGVAVEQQVVKGWAEFAKKSGKFVVEAAIDAGAGITAAALARTIVHGGKLDMSNSEEWITQGLSFAANRMVHSHATKMYSRLEYAAAKWGAETGPLKQKVLDLANQTDKITKPTPEQALEQLAKRHEYLTEERRLLDGNAKFSKTRSSNGDADKAKAQHGAAEQFAEVPLQLAGLSPVVQGHVYEGTKAQIDKAIAEAKKVGVDFVKHPDGTYRVGKRIITINEMGGTAAKAGRLAKHADSLGRDVTPIDEGRFRVRAGRLPEIHAELAAKGNKVGDIHFDAATNTAHFEMTAKGTKVRLEVTLGKITTVAELGALQHRVIGEPVSVKDGHELVAKLNGGDPYALAKLGISGDAKFPKGVEYGLGDVGGGKVIVVRGGASVVDWAYFPGVKPLAHTHPPVELKGGSIGVKEVFKATDVPSYVRQQVFPSGADFIVMAEKGVTGHVVYTELIIKDGKIMNAPPGDTSPRLNFTITASRRYGINGQAEAVYQSTMEMRAGAGTKPIETAEVWTVRPHNSDTGDLFMKRPKGVQETKPDGSPLTNPKASKTRSTPIDEAALNNLKNGLDATQIEAMVTRHGPDVVEWAGKSLDGAKARALLDGVQAKTIAGMRDVSALDAHAQLKAFGATTLDAIIPPVTGTHLNTERVQLGDTTAKALIKDKIDRGKIPDIATHATQLATASSRPGKPMKSNSLAVDSNVIIAIQDVTGSTPKKTWDTISNGERAAINYLRSTAKPPKPELLPTDKIARGTTARDLIGDGHDLRASNVTRGETKPTDTMPVGELPITVARNGAAYNKVLAELEANNIGKGKGGADRGVVADAIFADGSATLMTSDHSVIAGIYDKWGVKTRTVTQNHKEKIAAAISRTYALDGGFDANVPNGTGGTRRIRIIPKA